MNSYLLIILADKSPVWSSQSLGSTGLDAYNTRSRKLHFSLLTVAVYAQVKCSQPSYIYSLTQITVIKFVQG